MIQKFFDAWNDKNKDSVESMVDDDFVMTSHAQGAKMSKQDMLGWLDGPQAKRTILELYMKMTKLPWFINSWSFLVVIRKL